jgi:hypothetical protein
MRKAERYRAAMKQLKEVGLRAYMMRPDQLVFQTGHSNSGKSAWLAIYDGEWIIGTWAPRLYRIPSGSNLAGFCQSFVDDPSTMATVPDELLSRYHLERISEDETEAILEASPEPTYQSIASNLVQRGFKVDQHSRNNLIVFGYENGNPKEHYRCVSVCEFEGSWHILTMGPCAYRIPVEVSVEDVCADCLPSSDFEMFSIPEDLVIKHHLVLLPHEEWEKIDNSIEGSDH